MRIIAGEARGRRLAPLPGRQVRPTGDRVREAIFSLLEARLPGGVAGKRVLDLFAGSGALGLEAVSRGADHATFVESDTQAAAVIEANVARCGFLTRTRLVRHEVGLWLDAASGDAPGTYDLIFADPPYASDLHVEIVRRLGSAVEAAGDPAAGATRLREPLLAADAVLLVEHAARRPAPEASGGLVCFLRRVYGSAGIALYRALPSSPASDSAICL